MKLFETIRSAGGGKLVSALAAKADIAPGKAEEAMPVNTFLNWTMPALVNQQGGIVVRHQGAARDPPPAP